MAREHAYLVVRDMQVERIAQSIEEIEVQGLQLPVRGAGQVVARYEPVKLGHNQSCMQEYIFVKIR